MNVYQKVISAAQQNLAAPAFISSQGCMTYGQFISLIAFTSKELHQHGVVKGDVVGITPSHVQLHAALVISLAQLGAVSISLHRQLPSLELSKRIKRFGIKYVVRNGEISKIAGIDNIVFNKIEFVEGQHSFELAQEGLVEPKKNDPARFLLTSGSTGDAQAILHTQQSWVERVERTVDDMDANTRVILPDIYSTLGNIFMLGTLFAGGAIILARTNSYSELINDVNAYAASHLILPPYIFLSMLSHLPKQGIAFPTVKHLRPVGSSLSKPLLEALLTRISPNVYYPYGISEAGAISIATPSMLQKYPDTSGKIKSWSKAQIVDESGKVMKSGEVGRIRVKVEGMPTEYYQSPEVSKAKFRDGWFYSSDQGYINRAGLLFVQGRIDDLINLDGKKLNPAQLESQIVNNSAIADCALFTSMHEGSEKLFGAFIASKDEIIKALAGNPQLQTLVQGRYFSVSTLPRNDNGKVLRKDLASFFAKEISQLSSS